MARPKRRKPRVLVVDDEQVILDEFRNILCPSEDGSTSENELQELGTKLFGKDASGSWHSSFELVLCHQGEEAVEEVRAAVEKGKPFAVVFVDVRMPPGPDGVWTAEAIRKLDADVQIVVVTAYSDVDPLDISRRISPADKLLYVQKPFHPHELRQCAMSLAAKWIAENQLRERATELEGANEKLRHEVAEHRRTEKRRQLLSSAIMSIEDCVYITDTDGMIVFVNTAFCEAYGYDETEIIGQESSVLWDVNPVSGIEDCDYEADSGWEVAFFHKRKDGSRFPVSLSKANVQDETGDNVALVVIARDISERMQMERELRSEIMELKRRAAARGESVSSSSEELGAQLAAIKRMLRDTQEGVLGKISPKLGKNLESIESEIDKAMGIIGQFCNLSEAGINQVEIGA
ncbi:MAG: PAS domain-containing protein [Planctomycetota bacterium]